MPLDPRRHRGRQLAEVFQGVAPASGVPWVAAILTRDGWALRTSNLPRALGMEEAMKLELGLAVGIIPGFFSLPSRMTSAFSTPESSNPQLGRRGV